MRLHNLIKSGGTRKAKRIGRGESSGHGKTSGRGNKGQRARAGHSLRPGFESGHVPLYRKLPKRGFNNARFTTSFAIINVGDLAKITSDQIDRDVLVKAGLVRSSQRNLKVLGEGEIDRAITITASKFSASAKEKIEKAGGTVIVTQTVPEPDSED